MIIFKKILLMLLITILLEGIYFTVEINKINRKYDDFYAERIESNINQIFDNRY